MKDFLARLLAVLSAIGRCWVLLAIAGIASAVLLRTGQGLETLIADLPLEDHSRGSVFIGASVLAILIFLNSSLTLTNWRRGMVDSSTILARYTVPLLVPLLAICVLPVLILGVHEVSSAELGVMSRADLMLLAEVIVLVSYFRFVISSTAARQPATNIVRRVSCLIPKRNRYWRTVRAMIAFTTRRSSRNPIEKWLLMPTLEVLIFVPAAIAIVVGHRLSLVKVVWPANPRRGDAGKDFAAIWLLFLETMAAVLTALLLVVSWIVVARASLKAFLALAILIVALVDWVVVVGRVSPDLVAPIRERELKRRLFWSAAIVILAGFSLTSELPALSIVSFGAPFVLLFAVAFWVSVWTLIGMAALKGGAPRAFALILGWLGVAFFLAGPYNEGIVRTMRGAAPLGNTSVVKFAESWIDHRREDIERGNERYPVIIVAAEGGGIRAAYWTAIVLGALHDQFPCFSDHIFAISAVSGASIGAGVYSALAGSAYSSDAGCKGDSHILPIAKTILGTDLLSAQLAGALITDGVRSVVQSRLLPASLRLSTFPDRSAIFEVSLENAFYRATGRDALAQEWSRLWEGDYKRSMPPLVIPNVTAVGTGERVVLTPFAQPYEWPKGLDAAKWINGSRLRASTAVYLSARFPAISTTARLNDDPAAPRFVDGGYADNSGTATARDLGQIIVTVARSRGVAARIKPVFLVITNGNAHSTYAGNSWSETFAGTLLEPAATLMAIGNTSAIRYREDLKRDAAYWNGEVIDEFKVEYRDDRIPLGWMLAPTTRQLLDARLSELVVSEKIRGWAIKLAGNW